MRGVARLQNRRTTARTRADRAPRCARVSYGSEVRTRAHCGLAEAPPNPGRASDPPKSVRVETVRDSLAVQCAPSAHARPTKALPYLQPRRSDARDCPARSNAPRETNLDSYRAARQAACVPLAES